MTLHDDLVAAKALIDAPEKWGQGEYETSPGCYCALGAVAKATGVDPAPWNVEVGVLYDALKAALPPKAARLSVVDFNDAPETTHADIMALFDRAIAAAEPSK